MCTQKYFTWQIFLLVVDIYTRKMSGHRIITSGVCPGLKTLYSVHLTRPVNPCHYCHLITLTIHPHMNDVSNLLIHHHDITYDYLTWIAWRARRDICHSDISYIHYKYLTLKYHILSLYIDITLVSKYIMMHDVNRTSQRPSICDMIGPILALYHQLWPFKYVIHLL